MQGVKVRPVERGSWPQDKAGNNVQYSEYTQARGELIERIGECCSYCEMHLDSSLAVEHVQPKKPPGAAVVNVARALSWNNFLLACTNCNSTKGDEDVNLLDYFWPDRDNTFRAFKYSVGGIVSANPLLGSQNLIDKATKTIELTGLDKHPLNDPKASDRRWKNRREVWDIAARSKANLAKCDTPEMRDQITMTATGYGYWSIWMTVFENDKDMLQRLINAVAGTSQQCFDHQQKPVARNGGQC